MKHAQRKLLVIIPLLPLLMANSPAPQIRDEEYKDFEVTYLSEESYYGYNFYHFNLNNTGNGYIENVYLNSEPDASTNFYGAVESDEVCQPFYNGLIEPGFNREVIVVSKNQLPESKKVASQGYAYSTIAEEVTFTGTNAITYLVEVSDIKNGYYYYQIDCSLSNLNDEYYYACAIKLNYKGVTYCVKSNDTKNITISASSELDLSQLSVSEVVALKSTKTYYYTEFLNFDDALKAIGLFLLIFGLLLSFGIFSAIFFPAMARRKRRNRLLQEQNNK